MLMIGFRSIVIISWINTDTHRFRIELKAPHSSLAHSMPGHSEDEVGEQTSDEEA